MNSKLINRFVSYHIHIYRSVIILCLHFQTLLLDHKEVPAQLIEADFGDVEERSQKSGSFKGTKLSQRHAKDKGKLP